MYCDLNSTSASSFPIWADQLQSIPNRTHILLGYFTVLYNFSQLPICSRNQEGVWRHQSKPYYCGRRQRDIFSRFSHASRPLSTCNILRRLLRSLAGNAQDNQARYTHLPPARSLVLPVLPPTPASTLPLSLPSVPHASPLPTSLRVLPHGPQRQERTCQPHGAVIIRLSNTLFQRYQRNIVLFVLLLLVYVHFPSDVVICL